MASALLTGSVRATLRVGLLRRGCSAAAAASDAPTPAASSNDAANVTLRGSVERLLSAGPKLCFFTVSTTVIQPGLNRPFTQRHHVKAFGDRAELANSLVKVGGRVCVEGVLSYERRNRDRPAGNDNPYQCIIQAASIRADN